MLRARRTTRLLNRGVRAKRMGNQCINIRKLDDGKASEKANASPGALANTRMQHDWLDRQTQKTAIPILKCRTPSRQVMPSRWAAERTLLPVMFVQR